MLPNEFITYTRQLMGDGLWTVLHEGLTRQDPPVSVRLNGFKGDWPEGLRTLCKEAVPWCASGFYLRERPVFTFDPRFHAGAYYVQEASSMFLDEVLRQFVKTPVRMLDLCAAPGGKSTVARSALPEGSLLVCNEPVHGRAQILSENLQKWGHPDVVVTNNLPCDYARSGLLFDVVLADVPCSGEGMFRKDAGSVAEWRAQGVARSQRLQREIVSDIWPCLREGGLLVYSTCTFNARENEENIRWICDELGAEALSVEVQEDWHITPSLLPSVALPVYRFLPGLTQGEGLFMAVLRKTSPDEARQRKMHRRGKVPKENGVWLQHPERYVRVAEGPLLRAIPQAWADTYLYMCEHLRVLHAGVGLARQRGRDWVPEPSLALSTALNAAAFPQVPLTYNQAIAYLRRETLQLTASVPSGYVLLSYDGLPLGFAKNVAQRANNLYPSEWKIKSQHVPEYDPLLSFS